MVKKNEPKINYRHRLTQINTDKTNCNVQNLCNRCNLWLKSTMSNSNRARVNQCLKYMEIIRYIQ